MQWGVSCVCFRPLSECRVLARRTYISSSTGAAWPCVNTRPLFPIEHVLGGLPGSAHRRAVKPAHWMASTTASPRRSISMRFCPLHGIQLHWFSSTVLSLQTRRECASQEEVATFFQIERCLIPYSIHRLT